MLINSATNSTLPGLTVADIGQFYVVYTDPNGCISTSQTVTVAAGPSSELYIFPNPTNGKFGLRFENKPSQMVALKVYDLKGTIVVDRKALTGNNKYSLIDVGEGSKLHSGIYIVEIRDMNGTIIGTRQIVVQH